MPTTLAQAIPVVAQMANLSETDTRAIDYINQAQQMLLDHQGMSAWWGASKVMQITTSNGLITWPRSVAVVDSIAVCKQPIPIRNQWYEYLQGYGGLRPENSCTCGCNCPQLACFDRGTACLISDISGTARKLRARARSAADIGKKLLFQGYDNSSERIYTEYPPASGNYIEGEYLVLAAPQVDSAGYWTDVESVLKDVTVGYVDVYEYDSVTNMERLIATYEPTETNISYRRSYIDPIRNAGPLNTSTGCTSSLKVVQAMVKRAFIPAAVATDYLIVDNLRALKLGVMAILKEEKNLFQEADLYLNGTINPVTKNRQGGAIGALQAQMRTLYGESVSIEMNAHGTADLNRQRIGSLT